MGSGSWEVIIIMGYNLGYKEMGNLGQELGGVTGGWFASWQRLLPVGRWWGTVLGHSSVRGFSVSVSSPLLSQRLFLLVIRGWMCLGSKCLGGGDACAQV